MRSLTRNSTWNATGNRYEYPQTPSRIQLSLWPAGRAANAQGTIDWSGGPIDWNSVDIQDNGYYSAAFANITVQCYDPPAGSGDGNRSYVYVDKSGLESSVRVTNNSTVLPDLGHTGLNMKSGNSSADESSTDAGSSVTATAHSYEFTQHVKNNAPPQASQSVWVAILALLFMTIIS